MIILPLSTVREGVAIDICVQPRASRNEIVGLRGKELKVRLTSPPVEGAANKLCCEFFARLFGVSKGDVTILSGDKSRHKRLLIRGAAIDQIEHILAEQIKNV